VTPCIAESDWTKGVGGHHLYWEIGFRTQAVILKENVPGRERSVVHRTDSEGFALPK